MTPVVSIRAPMVERRALIAVVIGRFIGFWHPGDAPGFILSVVGAIMLMALYRVLKSKSA